MKFSSSRVEILLSATFKVIAMVFIAFCLFAFLASGDRGRSAWRGFSACLALGLTALFFLRQRFDDERVHSLKLKALKISFVAGYLISTWLESRVESGFRSPFTVYEFVIVTLLIALGLFHYWCWRDGRSAP